VSGPSAKVAYTEALGKIVLVLSQTFAWCASEEAKQIQDKITARTMMLDHRTPHRIPTRHTFEKQIREVGQVFDPRILRFFFEDVCLFWFSESMVDHARLCNKDHQAQARMVDPEQILGRWLELGHQMPVERLELLRQHAALISRDDAAHRLTLLQTWCETFVSLVRIAQGKSTEHSAELGFMCMSLVAGMSKLACGYHGVYTDQARLRLKLDLADKRLRQKGAQSVIHQDPRYPDPPSARLTPSELTTLRAMIALKRQSIEAPEFTVHPSYAQIMHETGRSKWQVSKLTLGLVQKGYAAKAYDSLDCQRMHKVAIYDEHKQRVASVMDLHLITLWRNAHPDEGKG
jgi:hypothetical protein